MNYRPWLWCVAIIGIVDRLAIGAHPVTLISLMPYGLFHARSPGLRSPVPARYVIIRI